MSQSTLSDEAILDLYFSRDERAITETDRQYGRICTQVSMNILHSPPDAEECVSDTYLKAWNAIPPERPRSLCAYVCRIVRNLSLNRLRDMNAARRNKDMTVSLSELDECLAVREDAVTELPRLLSDFLRTLDKRDRLLFMGRYWYARSVKDMATECGMTPNAVSVNLYRTREKLRAYLTERGYIV